MKNRNTALKWKSNSKIWILLKKNSAATSSIFFTFFEQKKEPMEKRNMRTVTKSEKGWEGVINPLL